MQSPRTQFIQAFLANHNSRNEFSEEGLNILIKFLEKDRDSAEKFSDELLVETIVSWYAEEDYGVFYKEEPGSFYDNDNEFDAIIKNTVQRHLETKRVFVGFTSKNTVIYCRGSYHDD